jgi:hypothetical protein
MPTSLPKPRSIAAHTALLILSATVWTALPAAAQSTVSGDAYGVSATSLVVTLTEFPDVDLDPQGGNASAFVAGLNLVGLLSTGAIGVATEGTTGPSNADAASTATVNQIDILAGLITADVVTAESVSTCDGTTASSHAGASTLANLTIAGVPIGALPPANTVVPINIPVLVTGSVTINEQIVGGNGTTTSSLTVNLLHVQVTTLVVGTVDLVIASAHSDVSCGPPVPTPTPTPGPCVPSGPISGDPIVSGEAFDLFLNVPPVAIPENPHVVLAPSGGTLGASVTSFSQPGVISTGTLIATTNGTTTPTMASSDATARVENLNLLAGLVTATLAQAVSSSSCNGTTATSSAANTMFANLVVNGMPQGNTPAPNTIIAIPGVATVTLNEQTFGGNGTSSSSLTVNLIHVVLAGGLGEAIVSSAHSDADCTPVLPPVPTCTPLPTSTPTPVSPTATATVITTATATAATPTPTGPPVTATPTPSPTATPPPDLNHFICYEIHRKAANLPGVSLVDQYGASLATVKQAKRICLPADKNDEDPLAVGAPETFTGFTIKQTSPRFPRQRGVTVTNQFGSVTLDMVKPDRLFVPTSKSLAGLPPPPMFPALDHFKCYKTALAKTRVSGIKIEDQFGTVTVDVKKPLHLCVPVDKNGEGIPSPGLAQMCYLVRTTSGTPRPLKQLPIALYTTHQFGSDVLEVFGPRELCVPSTLVP